MVSAQRTSSYVWQQFSVVWPSCVQAHALCASWTMFFTCPDRFCKIRFQNIHHFHPHGQISKLFHLDFAAQVFGRESTRKCGDLHESIFAGTKLSMLTINRLRVIVFFTAKHFRLHDPRIRPLPLWSARLQGAIDGNRLGTGSSHGASASNSCSSGTIGV